MSLGGLANEGDNIEFTAVNTGDYTIYLQHNTRTSANDEEFIKYPNNQDGLDGSGLTAIKFTIRTNQSVDLISLNGIVFTNPTTIIINKAHTETRRVPIIGKMVIRVGVVKTTLKVRWF